MSRWKPMDRVTVFYLGWLAGMLTALLIAFATYD